MNQVEKTLNGRDSYQIASGVWQIFWAIAIFDGLDGGSMGWINGYLGITAPVSVALSLFVGACLLMFGAPNTRNLFIGTLPMTVYSVITLLAVLSGETFVPTVAIIQTSFPTVLNYSYLNVRTRMYNLILSELEQEIDKHRTGG